MKAPSRWTAWNVVVYSLVLAIVFEAITAGLRFGVGLRSTRDTASLAPYTFGLRIHHGYLGVAGLLFACFLRSPGVRRLLIVLALALIVSDLLHHFVVLWWLTGDPQFDVYYPL